MRFWECLWFEVSLHGELVEQPLQCPGPFLDLGERLAGFGIEGLDQADSKTREQAMNLLDGEGMGEEIRVLVQAREVAVEAVLDLDVLGPLSA